MADHLGLGGGVDAAALHAPAVAQGHVPRRASDAAPRLVRQYQPLPLAAQLRAGGGGEGASRAPGASRASVRGECRRRRPAPAASRQRRLLRRHCLLLAGATVPARLKRADRGGARRDRRRWCRSRGACAGGVRAAASAGLHRASQPTHGAQPTPGDCGGPARPLWPRRGAHHELAGRRRPLRAGQLVPRGASGADGPRQPVRQRHLRRRGRARRGDDALQLLRGGLAVHVRAASRWLPAHPPHVHRRLAVARAAAAAQCIVPAEGGRGAPALVRSRRGRGPGRQAPPRACEGARQPS
mmetsp:Transcript_15505/g.49550  ORF Transcript_15505/g.49550 Transcript_15505/m.49550 type:complete len:298 (+) Transcript_15505:667-1560(+)